MSRIIVIGAGPAGLMAALTAAQNGASVLLLEKTEKPAKKLSISGSGQCNVTHNGDISMLCKHYGDKKKAAYQILKRFSNHDLIVFFKRLGLKLVKREDGKYFPESMTSQDVIECLIRALRDNKVQTAVNSPVCSIEKTNDIFLVTTSKERYTAKKIICATGGFTYPKTGSDGTFFSIPLKLGHHIIPLKKALTPVYCNDKDIHKLSGITVENAGLALKTHSGTAINKRGELLITHRGFSGPLIIDHSRYFQVGQDLTLNFTPCDNPDLLQKSLIDSSARHGKKSSASFFYDLEIPKRLVNTLISKVKIDRELPLSQLSKAKRKLLTEQFAEFHCVIEGLGNINESMVTAGGVDLKELKLSSMESKIVENLYFCGEMIDIDGDTGGYNIQIAFSTGFIAGQSVSRRG